MFFSKSTGGFYDEVIHGSAIPADAVEVAVEDYAILLAGQSGGLCIEPDSQGRPRLVERPAPTLDQVKAFLASVVQSHVDAPAKAWGYDSAASAVTYVGDLCARFNAEGLAIKEFRSSCWQVAGSIREAVLSGSRPPPSEAELLDEMPAAPSRPI